MLLHLIIIQFKYSGFMSFTETKLNEAFPNVNCSADLLLVDIVPYVNNSPSKIQ